MKQKKLLFLLLLSTTCCKVSPKGTIVILNGGSSSGKTILGQTLAQKLDNYVHLQGGSFMKGSFNYFYEHYTNEFQLVWKDLLRVLHTYFTDHQKSGCDDSDEPIYAHYKDTVTQALDKIRGPLKETLKHFHQKKIYGETKKIADSGTNVILEMILTYPDMLKYLVEELEGYNVIMIKVDCPLHELERREKKRGNRPIGFARKIFDVIHTYNGKDKCYDFAVDTHKDRLSVYTQQIIDFLASNPTCTAIEQNRQLIQDFNLP